MKTCTYCGKEYPDDAVRCLIDHEPLSSEETIPEVAPVAISASQQKKLWTERDMQIFELALVCIIAFGGGLLSSTNLFLNNNATSGQNRTSFSWLISSVREASALGLLWYVLTRRKKSFSDLGFKWDRRDFLWSILLCAGGELAYNGLYRLIYLSGLTHQSHDSASVQVGHYLFGGGIFLTTILFQFLNPFYEELIVRGYLMTEIKALTNNTAKAIMASTLLQMSYHFYQGAPAAFSHGATFLIFSIYYAKTNRITPVILAHLYLDVGGTLSYYWFR